MNLFNDFLNTISDTEVTTTSAIFKLMLSLLLGGIVGFERKRKGQVAGARTFALISMGATLAMIIYVSSLRRDAVRTGCRCRIWE